MRRYQVILSVLVFGAFASGIGGALTAGALLLPARTTAQADTLIMGEEQVFRGSAPAYPVWPPEPLYPRAERVIRDAAWDMPAPARRNAAAVNQAPSDLPPPYEVWMDGEERPVRDDRGRGGEDWRGGDWRDDGRRDAPRVEVYRRREEGPPPGYRGPPPQPSGPPVVVYGPPGYGPPPPPPGYYGPPRG